MKKKKQAKKTADSFYKQTILSLDNSIWNNKIYTDQ